jgi:hypothetical protein
MLAHELTDLPQLLYCTFKDLRLIKNGKKLAYFTEIIFRLIVATDVRQNTPAFSMPVFWPSRKAKPEQCAQKTR